ncbi:helix-turn-helix transcriptional regulator [uncultured Cytophaga sp.]|uniref:helix-turn-helix domain-containing protein n=1 Tax=uncultured Cytophaga sp. TaxID=160238 RepID=UPI002634B8F4|nr:helix-turn-helix transcriptional regulator [uncultured Cytophaga sp.]
MEESIVERVLILMKEFELTASEFADKIDVQRSSMSHLVSGRNKPSLDFIQKILNNFSDINPTWLIMGTGPMKQLDLFDIKGDVAPIQPFTSEQYSTRNQSTTIDSIEELNQKPITAEIPAIIIPQRVNTVLKETPIVTDSIADDPLKVPYKQSNVQVPESEISPIAKKVATIDTEKIPAAHMEQSMEQEKIEKSSDTTKKQEKSAQNDKKVLKIVFFYSDNTFETFNPN